MGGEGTTIVSLFNDHGEEIEGRKLNHRRVRKNRYVRPPYNEKGMVKEEGSAGLNRQRKAKRGKNGTRATMKEKKVARGITKWQERT